MAEPQPVPEDEDSSNPFLSNSAYDKLKWIAQIFLPGLATLVVTVFQILELPYGAKLGAVIMAVDFFLGTLLGVSAKKYKRSDSRFDGVMVVQEYPEKIDGHMMLKRSAEDLINQDEVSLKVVTPPPILEVGKVQEF